MQIGLLAPPVKPVPPARYGGTERVVAWLADALVDRGHDVTLFASGDSRTRARLVPTVPRAVWDDDRYTDDAPVRAAAAALAYRHAAGLDVVHNHLDFHAFSEARHAPVPTVTTLHWRLDPPEMTPLYAEFREQPVVAISEAQRAARPEANWIATVHHGLPAGLYRPGVGHGGYLAFCGRFSPEKGLATAIQVALAAGLPLRIAAPEPPRESRAPALRLQRAYYEAVFLPYRRHPLVEHVGALADEEKETFYGDALALLAPVAWPEPFGLVLIEALACGTPVLATPRGAVPEIVRPGVTGFHCEAVREFLAALARLDRLDRRACRADFEARFTAPRMAAAYERAYRDVQRLPPTTRARRPASAAA